MYYGFETGYGSPVHPNRMLMNLMEEAMRDERSDRSKYKMMMGMTNDKKVKDQINFAYEDEGKHYKMFQQIYYQLFGRTYDIPLPEPPKYDNLLAAVESSINGELKAVELYRKIQSMLPNMQLRDMLFEIITDEQEHATRFVYLYSMLK